MGALWTSHGPPATPSESESESERRREPVELSLLVVGPLDVLLSTGQRMAGRQEAAAPTGGSNFLFRPLWGHRRSMRRHQPPFPLISLPTLCW
jgi:hypothetical protein